MRKSVYTVSLLLFFVISPVFAAPILTVDQQNTGAITGFGGGGGVDLDYGQSFTPTLNRIDAVEFSLMTNGSGMTLRVDLYEGFGIGGTLLGSSALETITNTAPEIVHFDFQSSISLTPGDEYSLYVNAIAGSWFHIDAIDNNPYAGGMAFDNLGNAYSDADIIFTEGLHTLSVPEPSTMSFAAIGLLSLVGYRRRQQKKPA